MKVTERNFCVAVAMDLQGNVSFQRNIFLLLPIGNRPLTIEKDRHLLATGNDFVSIPLAHPLNRRNEIRVCLRQKAIAPRLIIEVARIACTDVCLETTHLIRRMGGSPAVKLYATIHESFCANKPVLEPQVKVFVDLVRRQEFVARIPLQTATRDDSILNAPNRFCVGIPAPE
nr:hypothetical protein [Cyclobacterium roseum]